MNQENRTKVWKPRRENRGPLDRVISEYMEAQNAVIRARREMYAQREKARNAEHEVIKALIASGQLDLIQVKWRTVQRLWANEKADARSDATHA